MEAQAYWESRYSDGGYSGPGSRGDIVRAKAVAINTFIRSASIASIVDWGCGDCALTELLALRGVDYCGIDISRTAVGIGLLRYGGRHQFIKWEPQSRVDISVRAELGLSVDVLFHLVDDADYRTYLAKLFESASRFVVIFAPSKPADPDNAAHVRHRQWLADVPEGWTLMDDPRPAAGPWQFGRDGAAW